MRSRVLAYRIRLRRRLRNRHRRVPISPFRRRKALRDWATFGQRREQRDLAGRVLWRYRMRFPRRRPIYGFIPFHEQRLRP